MPRTQLLDERRPFTRAEALRAGWSDREIAREVRAGRWVRLRHGALLPSAVHEAAQGAARHRLDVLAHQTRLAGDAPASAASAAHLLGLPLLTPPTQVELTSATAAARRRTELRVWHRPLPEGHVTTDAEGVLVTSPARTLVDLARRAPVEEALVVADAVLHRRLAAPEDVAEVLAVGQRWPGARAAARVVGLADGLAESAGETLTRLDLLALGHHDLVLQLPVQGASGRWYRADIGLPASRVLVEFDGAVKYDERAALLAEKDREDDLRLAGWAFVRVRWRDLGQHGLLADRLERAAAARTRSQR
ncbi:type IV toxin-antitoxin system AbiEi family antitoxin domain-containing protein [Motilibacter rhizosphaerae]|uniref:type IV toxin-antitoxin system AbiEi family antitoxin domain-containing protein n=1 Tax=Motilibacter rhizosphaerae TaxID=598652 RepID=UPI0013EEB347|nr:type IV toxin-antitoxin system AbiEi family antitoxin domain-containing protein [Motilibacter rhizosphaerae]